MAKIITTRAKVLQISTDRTQYKPYGYVAVPENLWIEMTLKPESVVEKFKDAEGNEITVVTMDGFSALLGSIADSIDSMHKEHEFKQTGLRR